MTTGISLTQAHNDLNLLAKGTAYAGFTTVFFQLHTGDPGAAGTTSIAPETTRKQITFGTPSSGIISNTNTLSWTAVAGSGLQTYTHCSLWSAVSSGTFIISGTMSGTVTAGNNFDIDPGGIQFLIFGIAA